MPIIPTQSTQYPPSSAVSLAAYARHIQVCECAFWGVEYADCEPRDCRLIWKKKQRDWVQYYLAEAQYELEQAINYRVGLQWEADERHGCGTPIIANWGYVLAGGVRAQSDVSLGQGIDLTSDPAVVGPVATTVTDVRQLHIYHAGTDIEIDPSSVTLAGGTVTFYIPRCRLVDPAYYDNPDNGWQYTNDTYFATTVDIKRVYNSTGTQAKLIQPASCKTCEDTEHDACIYVRKSDIGSLDIGRSSASCCYSFIDLNYYGGREIIDASGYYTAWGRQAQDAIIRLAHAKMPHAPCACDPVSDLWRRDREIIVDARGRALRGVSPFGAEEGAWTAWTFAQDMKLVKGATL